MEHKLPPVMVKLTGPLCTALKEDGLPITNLRKDQDSKYDKCLSPSHPYKLENQKLSLCKLGTNYAPGLWKVYPLAGSGFPHARHKWKHTAHFCCSDPGACVWRQSYQNTQDHGAQGPLTYVSSPKSGHTYHLLILLQQWTG